MGIKRSDQFQLIVKGLKGKPFHVQGFCGDKTGWKVSTCITRENPFEASVAKPAPDLPPDEGYVEEGNANDDSVKEKHRCYCLVWAELKTATSAILYFIKFVLYHFTIESPCFYGTNRKPSKRAF